MLVSLQVIMVDEENQGQLVDSLFVCNLCGCFQKQGYPQIIHLNRVFHYTPSILFFFTIFGSTAISYHYTLFIS